MTPMNTTRLIDAVENTLQKMKAAGIGFGESHLRAALDEAKQAPVFVWIGPEGISVTDQQNKEYPNIFVVDWLACEVSGDCPVCRTGLDADSETCASCGFNWAVGGMDEDTRAITAALAHQAKQKGPR